MRKAIVGIVITSVLYFILGFLSTIFGWLQMSTYLNYGAIFGSLASICGLLSFVIPNRISADDFDNVEIGYLKKVSVAADQLQEKRQEISSRTQALSETEKEIEALEIKRQEMEFLVKKASLSLFLKDRIERNNSRITEIVNSNPELRGLIEEIPSMKEKLLAVDEEIENDKNVDLLSEIINGERIEYKDIISFNENIRFMGADINLSEAAKTISKLIKS